MSKLILGTAQFGSDYGIKHDGQPSIAEIEKIARVAWDAGIKEIHTSWQYPFNGIGFFHDFSKITKSIEDPNNFFWDGKRGISIYNPKEAKGEYHEMIQFPLNVLDTRCLNIEMGQIVSIARSVFLQGLLLMENLPGWLTLDAAMKIRMFHDACREYDMEYYEACLGWVLGQDTVDKVIVGVNSAEQLEQLVKVKPLKWDYDFSIRDERVLDPRRWPKQ